MPTHGAALSVPSRNIELRGGEQKVCTFGRNTRFSRPDRLILGQLRCQWNCATAIVRGRGGDDLTFGMYGLENDVRDMGFVIVRLGLSRAASFWPTVRAAAV